MDTIPDYRAPNGIAAFWSKDGCYHVARPSPVDGIIRWTGEEYDTLQGAIEALKTTQKIVQS